MPLDARVALAFAPHPSVDQIPVFAMDAHQPAHVGLGIPEALAMVQTAGFSAVTTFVRRRPVEHPLG